VYYVSAPDISATFFAVTLVKQTLVPFHAKACAAMGYVGQANLINLARRCIETQIAQGFF